tara:strand:+ start:691 stop:834 length:144 start_codon:yes stop_codon:yes gene_type:complete
MLMATFLSQVGRMGGIIEVTGPTAHTPNAVKQQKEQKKATQIEITGV